MSLSRQSPFLPYLGHTQPYTPFQEKKNFDYDGQMQITVPSVEVGFGENLSNDWLPFVTILSRPKDDLEFERTAAGNPCACMYYRPGIVLSLSQHPGKVGTDMIVALNAKGHTWWLTLLISAPERQRQTVL